MENKTAGFNNVSSGSAVDSTLNKVSTGAHSAVDRAAEMADDAARRAKPTIDRVIGYAHQAVDRAAGAAAPAAEWLDEHGQDLRASQAKMIAATGDYVKQNPWKAVGIAVVAGILLGRIVL